MTLHIEAEQNRPAIRKARRWRVSTANMFILPAAVLSIILIAVPLLGLVTASLFDWKLIGTGSAKFIWLNNYLRLLQDGAFWHSVWITALFVVESVGLQTVAGVAIALLFNQKLPGLALIRTLFLAPMMIAPIFAGMIWRLFLSDDFGLAKYMLQVAGMTRPPLWLADSNISIHVIALIVSWQWTPFVVLFVLAGLQVIPRELHEAAKLDGAGPFRRFTAITLPLLLPILSAVIVFRVIDAIKVFDLIYSTTGGGPGDSTETISYLVYKQSMTFFDMGYGSTVATVMLIIVASMALLLMKVNERAARVRAR